jgi:hypothetical protein
MCIGGSSPGQVDYRRLSHEMKNVPGRRYTHVIRVLSEHYELIIVCRLRFERGSFERGQAGKEREERIEFLFRDHSKVTGSVSTHSRTVDFVPIYNQNT